MFAAQKIKHNMMCGYSDDEKENRPPLTEFELKARRALDKMSIPNWFLNRKSATPKILRNNTPIEYWPKPWKKGKTEKSGKDVQNLHIKPTLGANHPADTHKMKRNFDEPKDHRFVNRIPSSHHHHRPRGQILPSPMYHTDLSEELEIKFSPTRYSPTHQVLEETQSNSSSSSQKEYLDAEFSLEDNASRNEYRETEISRKTCSSKQEPAALETMTECFSEKKETIQTKKTKTKLFINGSHTFPKASPSKKIENINIVLPTFTPPVLYDDSTSTSSAVRDVGEEEENETIVGNSIVATPTKVPEELPTAGKLTTKFLSQESPPSFTWINVERLQPKCTNDMTSSDYYSATSTMDSSVNSSIDNKPIETSLRSSPQFYTSSPRDSFCTASNSSVDRLLISKNKSTELQKILRETKTTCYEKGLVKKIIEELNKGNEKPVDTSYRRPESRNSVKKLVDAFEKQMNGTRVEDEGEKTYSESETSLATVVNRRSIEIKHGAYWIPANPTRYIRKSEFLLQSSSLLSITSAKSSTSGNCLQSPSVSPIPHYANHRDFPLGWGLTYTKKGSKRLFHVDETDSGYLEKSEKIQTTSL